MAEVTGIRWGWLRFMYAYTIVGAGGFGLAILTMPDRMRGVRRNGLNAKVFTLFACVLLVISCGCSQPEAPKSCAQTGGPTDFHSGRFEEWPVHYETQVETLARVLAEAEAAKTRAEGAVHKEWYGSTPLGLGRLRKITVPHVPAGGDGESRAVTTPQIHKALTEYVLIDYETFRSAIHIPAGTCVTIEYENGMIGWINMYGGIPWNVRLQKDGSAGEYGLRRTSEQSVAPQAAAPPR